MTTFEFGDTVQRESDQPDAEPLQLVEQPSLQQVMQRNEVVEMGKVPGCVCEGVLAGTDAGGITGGHIGGTINPGGMAKGFGELVVPLALEVEGGIMPVWEHEGRHGKTTRWKWHAHSEHCRIKPRKVGRCLRI